MRTNQKYQQDEESSTSETNTNTITTTTTNNEDDEEMTERSVTSVSSVTTSDSTTNRSPTPEPTTVIITAAPPTKPASQVTLISTLTTSTSSNSIQSTTKPSGGYLNRAYNQSEPNLFTVFTVGNSKIPPKINEENGSNVKKQSPGAVLQRQTGGGLHQSKTLAINKSSSTSGGRKNKFKFNQPVCIVPLILLCLFLMCLLLGGLVYLLVTHGGSEPTEKYSDKQHQLANANNTTTSSSGKDSSPPHVDQSESAAMAVEQQAQVAVSVRSMYFVLYIEKVLNWLKAELSYQKRI